MKRLKFIKVVRILSLLLTLSILTHWYLNDSEAEPWSIIEGKFESSRSITLKSFIKASNDGYFWQLSPGVPMEALWEDPGMHYFLGWIGLVKKIFQLGPMSADSEPYFLCFALSLLPILLIYSNKLFKLPSWYWVVPPIFFLWAIVPQYPTGDYFGYSKVNGLLYMSISMRWAKVPAAFWAVTVAIQIVQWWYEGSLYRFSRQRFVRLVLMGFVFGLFVSFRKDLMVTYVLALATIWVGLLFASLSQQGYKYASTSFASQKVKQALFNTALVGSIVAGLFAPRLVFQGTWFLRDRIYVMQETPRIYGHPIWHSLYASLGVVPNELGIIWGDEVPWKHIQAQPEYSGTRLVYGTVEHEKAARTLFIKTIKGHPGLVWENIKFKSGRVWEDHRVPLLYAMGGLFVLFMMGRYFRLIAFVLLAHCLMSASILVLVNPWREYSLDLMTYYRMISPCAVVLSLSWCWLLITRYFPKLRNSSATWSPLEA